MIDHETVGGWADLINKYGFLLIFAILSGLLNGYFVLMIIRGKLVTFDLYMRAVNEAERLQRLMEKTHSVHWTKVLEYLSGLKPNRGGTRHADLRTRHNDDT